MSGAATPELRLLEGVSLDPPAAGPGGPPASLRAVAAVRAARTIVDRLTRADRRRVAAVVACVAGESERGAAAAKLAVSALSLGASLPLHVSGLDSCGLFTALHLAHALLRSAPDALVLVIRSGAGAPHPDGSGALLLGAQGGVVCRPLPPARAEVARIADAETQDLMCGAALALTLSRAGFCGDDVQRVASPGAPSRVLERLMRSAGLEHAFAASMDTRVAPAATLEAALGAAVQAPPEASTLLWARDPDGQVGACLLGPG